MIMNLMAQIEKATIEALQLARRMQEKSNEGFIVEVSIPAKLNSSTISIRAAKRPFPAHDKFPLIHAAIGGHWDFKHTNPAKYTKISQTKYFGVITRVINLYTAECFEETSRKNITVLRGTRSKVLNPQDCNGFIIPVLAKYRIVDKRQISQPKLEHVEVP